MIKPASSADIRNPSGFLHRHELISSALRAFFILIERKRGLITRVRVEGLRCRPPPLNRWDFLSQMSARLIHRGPIAMGR